MRRIDDGMDWVELEKIAAYRELKLVYRVARCQHGKTRQQTCRDCEGGYVDDTHTFANVGNVATTAAGQALIAVSDDGESVAYVPASQQSRTRFVVVVVDKYIGNYTGRYLAWAVADRQRANRVVSKKYDSQTDAQLEADRMNREECN